MAIGSANPVSFMIHAILKYENVIILMEKMGN